MEGITVELRHITKTFGSVIANNDINLHIESGEIHALLGENGSGKSTLMNILSGIYKQDSGEIFVNGKLADFRSPKDPIKAGIGMVHQHFKLVDVSSAKENIIAGDKGFLIRNKKLSKKIKDVADKFGLSIDPDKKIYNMSVGEKQTVEILKMLYKGSKLLILDEPTAVLTPQEIKVLFSILRNMKKQNCAVIIITHKLNEVMEISDKVTVLRKGECIKTFITNQTDIKELTNLMVGREISLEIERIKTEIKLKKELLNIKNLTVKNFEHFNALEDISFTISSGEILGVAGLAGSGQKELCEAIAGLEHVYSGEIIFKNENIVGLSPRIIIKKGIAMSFIPEDRLGMGLVGSMDIIDNVLLKSYRNKKGVLIDRKEGKRIAEEIIKRFDISTPGASHTVKKLSGGNIQKVLLGREVSLNPDLLITAYPVRGLDIGASYNIYDVLNEQKKKGVGILFVGEDLDALLSLCDRIMVIHGGKIMDILEAEKATKEQLGMLMLGHKQEVGKNV